MNRKMTYLLIASAIVFLALVEPVVRMWPIHRGGPQLQGYTTEDIPIGLELKWKFKTDAEIKSSPVNAYNKTYITSTDGFVYCLNLMGKLLWKYDTKNAIEASATYFDNMLYVGNLSGEIVALNATNGKLVWKYDTDNQIMGAPNYFSTDSGKYILLGSYDYNLYCLEAKTGAFVWSYELDNYLNGTVAIKDNKAVFGGCDGFLHSVDLKEGELDHKFDISTYIASSPAIYGDHALVADYDGNMFSINLKENTINWTWKNGESNIAFIASPAVHKGKMVNCSRDKHTYCIDVESGNLLWKRNSGYRIDASPIISNDKALVANMRGDIQVLQLKDGAVLDTYELGTPVASNPSVYKGCLYFGGMDGFVYCLSSKKN
jgi:outer membrane protein assembly factor BamB